MLIINHTQDIKYILGQSSQLKLEQGLLQSSKRFDCVEMHVENFVKVHYMDGFYDSYINHFLSYAHAYISLIPIVFVTQSQSNTSFFAGLRTPIFNYSQINVPNDQLFVPKIAKTGLLEHVETLRFDEAKLDLWGLYCLQEGGPVIFIWVDKIHEYAKEKFPKQLRKYYELHVCQTIFHEVMHALMDDINRFGKYYIRDINGNILKALDDLKEESLAEAGSIALMKKFWSSKDIKYLLDYIGKNDLFQYSLGAELYRTGISLVDCSVSNWAEFRYGGSINLNEYINWIKYVTSHQKYNLQVLKNFETRIFP